MALSLQYLWDALARDGGIGMAGRGGRSRRGDNGNALHAIIVVRIF